MSQQLELSITRRAKTKSTGPFDHTSIPGLDASLCRCDYCLTRSNGIWWVDADQRSDCLNKLKHKHPYLIKVYSRISTGVDHDQESKETKAQNAKRQNPQWVGQKFNNNKLDKCQQQLLSQ